MERLRETAEEELTEYPLSENDPTFPASGVPTPLPAREPPPPPPSPPGPSRPPRASPKPKRKSSPAARRVEFPPTPNIDDEEPPRSRAWLWVVVTLVLIAGGLAAVALLGVEASKPKANTARASVDAGAATMDAAVQVAVAAPEPRTPEDAGAVEQTPDAAVAVAPEAEPSAAAQEPESAAAPAPPPAADPRPKLQWTLPARFPAGGTSPSPKNFKATVRLVKTALARCGGKVVLEGHSSYLGTDVAQRLALERAQLVRKRLIKLGVSAAALEAVSLGDSKPVASNGTARGRAQNRRVTLRCAE